MPILRRRGGTCSPRSGAATSSPPIEIMPAVGCSSPAMQRKVVVLPQPEGPSSTTISPAAMRKLTSSTAGRPTRNCLRRCETFSSADICRSIHYHIFRSSPRKRGPSSWPWIPAYAGMSGASDSLPIPIGLVPFIEPVLLQLHELLVVRDPHLDDFRIEAFRVERRLLQRGEIADHLDHRRLSLFGEAPVHEQLGGVRMCGCLRDARRERRDRRTFGREKHLHGRAVAQL